jgi:hypothetical protein
MTEKNVKIRLTLGVELLCQIWSSRTDPNQTIDTWIQELLIKGLATKQ